MSTLLYIWLMDLKNVVDFKKITIITLVLWFIYDFVVKLYTTAFFDFASVISNVYAINEINNKKKSDKNGNIRNRKKVKRIR